MPRRKRVKFVVKKIKCDICGVTVQDIKQHRKDQHMQAVIPCPYDNCDKVFEKMKQVYNHKRFCQFRPEEDSVLCEICNKRFTCKDSLKTHNTTCHEIGEFKCGECNRKFPTNVHLRNHKLRRHDEGDEELECPHCDLLFKNTALVSSHKQNCHSEPRYCDQCNYSCRDATRLKAHVAEHDGVKLYLCSLCDFSCNRGDVLSTHVKLKHSMSAEHFKCVFCSKIYLHPDTLKKHMKLHGPEISTATLQTTVLSHPLGTNCCNDEDCVIHPFILENRVLTCNGTDISNNNKEFNCDSSNVVYCITCQACWGAWYVGLTSQPFKDRMKQHMKRCVRNGQEDLYQHFQPQNNVNHTPQDMVFLILQQVTDVNDLRHQEARTIQAFTASLPHAIKLNMVRTD